MRYKNYSYQPVITRLLTWASRNPLNCHPKINRFSHHHRVNRTGNHKTDKETTL